MAHSVETPSETEATVRIQVSGEALQNAVNRELQSLSHKVKLPGFRPGKIPQKVLRKKYGEAVELEVKQKLIEHEFQHAIADHKLMPVSAPSLEPEQLEADADGGLNVEFKIEVIPPFELSAYRDLRVGAPPAQIQDEDVQRELEGLRHQNAQAEVVADGPAASGDLLVADLTYQFLDGTSLPVQENRVIDTGAGTVDGIATEADIGRFVGVSPGAEVKVTVTLPEDFPLEDHRGKTAVARCVIKEVRRIALPDLEDPEFLKRFGAESVADLQELVRRQMGAQLENRRRRMEEDLCLEQLLERNPITLPAGYVERSYEAERDRMRKDLVERGTPNDEVEKHLLEVDGRLREQTERRLRETILLDRVAEAEEVRVEEEDLQDHFSRMSRALQIPAQQLFDHFVENDSMSGVLQGIRRDKTRRILRDYATTTDESGTDEVTPETTDAEEAS